MRARARRATIDVHVAQSMVTVSETDRTTGAAVGAGAVGAGTGALVGGTTGTLVGGTTGMAVGAGAGTAVGAGAGTAVGAGAGMPVGENVTVS